MKKSKIEQFQFDIKRTIDDQRKLGEIRYGLFGSAKKNACGIIACNNLKMLIGEHTDFIKEYKKASLWGTTLGLGIFGTNPFYVAKKIKKMNISVKPYRFVKLEKLGDIFEKSDIVVLLYRWGSIFNIHYAVFERKSDGLIYGYNTVCDNYKQISTLIKAERMKSVIMAWAINK
jgi:hypothetical protein